MGLDYGKIIKKFSNYLKKKKLKKDKIVILTTHAMEEADILSSRIAVIVDGELKCIGTSLYLKNKYGDGYRLEKIFYI